ncbi:MAG: Rpn family recombination-promoting nuclease/putative transposase [Myxococcota bacterium]
MARLDALPTPHDRLVKWVFSRPETAAVLLRRVLPPKVLACLDLERIHVVSTSLVGPRLGLGHSDLIYSIGVRGSSERLMVFAAIEHQSSPSPLMPLRMVRYVVWVWERHLAMAGSQARTIPLVFPIVMVQRPSKWNGPNRLSELFEIPDALDGVLRPPVELELYIDDMSESVLDDPVASPEVLALVELTRALMVAYHDRASLTDARIEQLAPLFDRVLRHRREDAEALWTYVVHCFDDDSPVLEMLLNAVSKENQAMGRTYREAWLEEGMAKGMAKALLQLLEHRRVPISSEQQRRVLTTQDEPTLERWFQRALCADSVERVFEPVA